MVFVLSMLADPVSAPLLILFVQRLHTLLLHSRFTSSWGCFGDWLFQSPAAHRVHHSIFLLHHNKNYGATLIIWDRLFNTFQNLPRIEIEKINLGIAGVKISRNPIKNLIDDAREFYLTLLKLKKFR